MIEQDPKTSEAANPVTDAAIEGRSAGRTPAAPSEVTLEPTRPAHEEVISPAKGTEIVAAISARLAAQEDLLRSCHKLLVESSARLARLDNESVARTLHPLFIDLILLFDSLQQAIAWARSSPSSDREVFEERLQILQTELIEILLRRDVELQEEEVVGGLLDRRRHRVVKTFPAEIADEDNRICQVIRAGFVVGGRVLRPADVAIRKFEARLQKEGE